MFRDNPIVINKYTPIDRVKSLFSLTDSALILDAAPEVVAAMHPLIRQVTLFADTKAATVAVISSRVHTATLCNISVDAAKELRIDNVVINEISPEVMAILSKKYHFVGKLGTLRACDDKLSSSQVNAAPNRNDNFTQLLRSASRLTYETTTMQAANLRLCNTVDVWNVTPEVINELNPLVNTAVLSPKATASAVAMIPQSVNLAYVNGISVDVAEALRVKNIVIEKASREVKLVLFAKYTFVGMKGTRKANKTLDIISALKTGADNDNHRSSSTTQQPQPAQNNLLAENEALRARITELTTERAMLAERLARYEEKYGDLEQPEKRPRRSPTPPPPL